MKANIEFNLPEDQEHFNVAVKSMDWALLAWDIDQSIRSLLKGENLRSSSLEQLRDQINDIMEERGLQFPA